MQGGAKQLDDLAKAASEQAAKPTGEAGSTAALHEQEILIEKQKLEHQSESNRRDSLRDQRSKECQHWLMLGVGVVLTITAVSLLVVGILQFVLPVDRRWLAAEERTELMKFLTGGVVGGVLTKGAETVFAKSKKPPAPSGRRNGRR